MVTVCPSQFATRRTLFHVLVGCGLLMLKVSRLKLPVIWLLVSMWLKDRKSGSAGMPRPISYAVFCLKKKKKGSEGAERQQSRQNELDQGPDDLDATEERHHDHRWPARLD